VSLVKSSLLNPRRGLFVELKKAIISINRHFILRKRTRLGIYCGIKPTSTVFSTEYHKTDFEGFRLSGRLPSGFLMWRKIDFALLLVLRLRCENNNGGKGRLAKKRNSQPIFSNYFTKVKIEYWSR
jgi:hypothetical protein